MNEQHKNDCLCRSCERIRTKTISTAVWLQTHLQHSAMRTEPFEHYPGDDLFWLVCECGAKHLTRAQDAPAPIDGQSQYNVTTEIEYRHGAEADNNENHRHTS